MPSKKRKRAEERPTIHPRNKYSEKPPDFGVLASLYPTFNPYVFYSSRDGKPRIDWTDYNATRELTRVLLLHDHALNWWIPDGQLCPTVPNRSNYIHWIEDLLSSDIIPKDGLDKDVVKGFNIGTGANCIYPLLGASLLGWKFVGSDVTEVALDWAQQNVKNNPNVSHLIEIRKVDCDPGVCDEKEVEYGQSIDGASSKGLCHLKVTYTDHPSPSHPQALHSMAEKSYDGPPILVGVVKDYERFDFCMCNPPFFETMEVAGLNPKTACGGTPEEMVCPGGEQAFITRMIEDSTKLKESFRWYTSMVGRKANLKILISKLRDSGVTIVKQTEFVQGQTCRWGLAWSFISPSRTSVPRHVTDKKNLSFMLEGLQRQHTVVHVLQSLETFFCCGGASCKVDISSFKIDVIASKKTCEAIMKAETHVYGSESCQSEDLSNHPTNLDTSELQFSISVFQQTPGTLLVKGLLCHRESPSSGEFFLIFRKLEDVMKDKFCKVKASAAGRSCS